MPHRNGTVIGPPNDDDDEQLSPAYETPHYPQITRAQWALLVQLTDQNCKEMLDAMTFYQSLSIEAREFWEKADKEKIELLKSNLSFYANSKVIWKFLLVGGGMFFTAVAGVATFVKLFGDYFTVKFK